MNLFERLRVFFSQSQPAQPILSPPAIVEQMRVNRGYKAAQPAAPWSDDIKAHNHWVNAEHEQRRLFLITGYSNGSIPLPAGFPAILAARRVTQTGLWATSSLEPLDPQDFETLCHELAIGDLVQAQMWRESRNVDATKQAPLQPLMTADERQQAREFGQLKSTVDHFEEQKVRAEQRAQRTERPSVEEVLAAAGGNVQRAAQVEAKLDALFGAREPVLTATTSEDYGDDYYSW